MLPSLPALRAFDAAARLQSFRKAADHLSVTPTAISHHVRALEDTLMVRLFDREGRNVRPSAEGRRLAEATSRAFAILEDAVNTARGLSRPVVRLGAGPIFTARWLMPRIGEFRERHPDHVLEVVPSSRPGELSRDTVDIVIRWERLRDMPTDAVRLLALQPVAVASPDFIARHGPFRNPADLLSAPILHQRNHWGWSDWFASQGVTPPDRFRGPVFDDANVLMRGAAEGQGAIVGWMPLIERDLDEGRVIRLLEEDITPTHGYFMSIPRGTVTSRETRRAYEWLASHACGADSAESRRNRSPRGEEAAE